MRELWDIAWHRFNIISSVVGDANARVISVLFYFTILVPFGIGSRLMSDPMRIKPVQKADGKSYPAGHEWAKRDPIPTDIDSARLQG